MPREDAIVAREQERRAITGRSQDEERLPNRRDGLEADAVGRRQPGNQPDPDAVPSGAAGQPDFGGERAQCGAVSDGLVDDRRGVGKRGTGPARQAQAPGGTARDGHEREG